MPVLARLQPLRDSPDERRRTPRLLLKLGTRLGSGTDAVVHDISTKGLLFETAGDLGSDRIHVHLPEHPTASARIVWNHGRFYGCEFEEPIANASVSAALLRSEPRSWDEFQHAPVAESHVRQKERKSPSLRGWIGAAIAVAVSVAGAGALILSGQHIALIVILLVAIAILGLVAATMFWALDNTLNIKF